MKLIIFFILIPTMVLSQSNFWEASGSGITEPINYISVDYVGNDAKEVFVATNHTIYSSSNNGDTWVSCSQGLDSTMNIIGLVNGQSDYLFCLLGGSTNRIYRSTNAGVSWSDFSRYVPNFGEWWWNNNLKSDRFGRIWLTGEWTYPAGGISTFWTNDNGTTWQQMQIAGEDILMGDVVSSPQADMFFCGRDRWSLRQVWRTMNGDPWNNCATFSYSWTPPRAITVTSQGTVFVGVDASGIYRSVQKGDSGSWSLANQGLRSLNVSSLVAAEGNYVYAATDSGIFQSSNNGDLWTPLNDGLDKLGIKSLKISSRKFLFAVTSDGLLYRSVQKVTSVKANQNGNPLQFSLCQNYPNPFNPNTTIQFSIGHSSVVSLKVFDILGRDVATIVSGEFEPGTYKEIWDASNVASGLYFYRLVAGDFLSVRRMLVLK